MTSICVAMSKTYCIWWCTFPSSRNSPWLWGICICPGDMNKTIRHSPYRYTDSSRRLRSYPRTDMLRRMRNQLEGRRVRR